MSDTTKTLQASDRLWNRTVNVLTLALMLIVPAAGGVAAMVKLQITQAVQQEQISTLTGTQQQHGARQEKLEDSLHSIDTHLAHLDGYYKALLERQGK